MRKTIKVKKHIVPRLKIHLGPKMINQAKGMLINYALNLLGKHEFTEEFLQFLLSLLHRNSVEQLCDCLYGKSTRKKYANTYEEAFEDESEDVPYKDINRLSKHISSDIQKGKLRCSKFRMMKQLNKALQKENLNNRQENPAGTEITNLKNLFDFSDEEVAIVYLLFCRSQSDEFNNLCDTYSFSEFLIFIAVALNISIESVRKLLSTTGKLLKNGVVEVDIYRLYSRGNGSSVTDDIIIYLSGITDISLPEKYCRKDADSAYPVNSYSIPEQQMRIIHSLLCSDEPCNILLYGEAGTGKTEFARSIVRHTGKQAFFVQHGEDGTQKQRKLALQVASSTVGKKGGILIVDEADNFLNTDYMFFIRESMEKGILNQFMDTSKVKTIWITNRVFQMEDSLLRRFSYSLQFKKFTRKERENIWNECLKEHPFRQHFPPEVIRSLSEKYQVNACGIGHSLNTLKAVVQDINTDMATVHAVVKEILTRHQDLLRLDNGNSLNMLTDNYDISALNTDVNAQTMVGSLMNFIKIREAKPEKDGFNMNLLFWGKPGTGKTEFAKYLARETGKDLLIRRASDLLSMWVGMTEKLIKEAFEEAKRENAILFIDEADSFFTSRENACRSWEISQTNELLTQMENHSGVLICCTNLLHNLDKAAMRRFNWKIEFKPLAREGKLSLYMKYFQNNGKELTIVQKERIMSIPDLTPGDVKAVWQKMRFLPDSAKDHDFVISSIETEVKYKKDDVKGRMGFSG